MTAEGLNNERWFRDLRPWCQLEVGHGGGIGDIYVRAAAIRRQARTHDELLSNLPDHRQGEVP